jgi:lysozyme
MTDIENISVSGLNGIRQWEGRALRAYQDEVGVWTIGYGITNMDKGIGFKVQSGATITAEQAEQLLYASLRQNYLPATRRALSPQSKLAHPQGAIDGGVSFHYNTGGISRASWPKFLVAGNLEQAKTGLASWNKAGGKVLSGLVRRRAWEIGVIFNGDYGHLAGPDILDEHERSIGSGELLKALPGDATSAVIPGDVQTSGVPKATTPAPGTLMLGSQGAAVLEIQQLLIANGFLAPLNSVYDTATRNQVMKFQQHHPEISSDGIVGPATRAALVRGAALRAKLSTVAKVAPVVPVAAGGLWHWVSTGLGEMVLVGGAVAVTLGTAYVVWHHWADVKAFVNTKVSRVVL